MKENRKKVLFLIHTLQIGGAERILVNLVNNLPKNRYDITVMTVVDVGALKNQLKPHIKYKTIFSFKFLRRISGGSNKYNESTSASIRSNPLKEIFIKSYILFWKYANIKKLYKKYITEKYDIEVSFLEGIPAKIVASSNNKKSKKICWIHVDLINENKSDRFFKNINDQENIYKKFDKIVCVSEIVKDQFRKKINIDNRKIDVIYNPIDSDNIVYKSRKEINLKKTKTTFCSIGRLARQKGYDRLINACARLENEGYNFDVWIIGVGAEERNLRGQIKHLNVKNIKLLGYKNNPYPYIKAADWYLCSSRAEGFSTAVAESIILKKPIISTDCSGAKEMLGKKSEYGIVCENSESGIYESMKRVLDNKQLAVEYKKSVKLRSKLFVLEESIDKINEMLEVKS